MASSTRRLPENAPGDFYVDSTCIDCGTCRQVAPASFAQGRDASFVHRQPADECETQRARMALVACPVAAIGTGTRHRMQAARGAFPEHIDGGVHYCGYAAEASYGARSYLVVRPRGNILVDSPRYSAPLLERIEALGGVRWMFLTHKDDVAEHRKFRARFGCERILHRDDAGPGTRDVERMLEGERPVPLETADDENAEALLIPAPGHTAGSVCLLYRNKYLFTGDHASWDPALGRIVASRHVCWHDWGRQSASMERLGGFNFEWILPGHGMRGNASAARMRAELARCVATMKQHA
jgi:glyoxylase-like metal-dependent hydrolase (beta-lactamase superfamily II)/ferredoxin